MYNNIVFFMEKCGMCDVICSKRSSLNNQMEKNQFMAFSIEYDEFNVHNQVHSSTELN